MTSSENRAFAADLGDSTMSEFSAALRSFYRRCLPKGATDVARDPVHCSKLLWPRLVAELDVAGLALPEIHGGSGLGLRAHAIVQREAGRLLAHTPYLSTIVLAATAILEVDDPGAHRRFLPQLASGAITATLLLGDDPARDAPAVDAVAHEDGYRLTGSARRVLDGATADLLLTRARTAHGTRLFAVDGTSPGVQRVELQTLDLSRPMADIVLRDAPGELIGPIIEVAEPVSVLGQELVPPDGLLSPSLLDTAAVALAAEALGAAEQCLEDATRYATARYQFGRPIGSFQAVKHRLADMRLAVDRALFGVDIGLGVDVGLDNATARSSLALATAIDTLIYVAEQAMQVYGGLSITWEHPAHLYLRRAYSTAQLIGPASFHRERFLDLATASFRSSS